MRRLGQPVVAHQRDVRPRDRQNARRCPTARRTRCRTPAAWPRSHHRMAGQERREVLRHADRSHARAAAAVRDAERLVQVQVADVGADVARPAEPDLRVHVGAVHVHLPAVLVNDLADLPDRLLEHAVRRRVGHHQRGERVCDAASALARRSATSMLPCASLATGTTCMPGHHRARGVGAVGRLRNQADGAMRVAARRGDRRGSPAGRRTRPASRRSAAARPRRSR